ncbi:MAG TPA: rhodanese-like domain-containing protein [Bdellovibrionales bacterium]|nr:rhodanese-like domain-containing protein [Bdellovibrionales bacterium]
MERPLHLDTLTCEQIYNVWLTDAQLIEIYDLRTPEEFERFHIPGARRVSASELEDLIPRLGGVLGVIIAPPPLHQELKSRYGHLRDVAFLKDCDRMEKVFKKTGGQHMSIKLPEPELVNGVPTVSVRNVHDHLGEVRLIDVRRSEEFNNELGHIPGAELATLGPELTNLLTKGDRAQEIVFVCRSGARSATATLESMKLGYKYTKNMEGGMIVWNESRFPVRRDK